ncbi:MAG TPA: HYR domain-containing protein, partial [Pyrinomonadaceae bacterium]
PGNQTLEATSAAGAAATWTEPTATDAVDGARPVVCTPLAGSTFPLGTTTVNCEASDNSSHTSSASFTIQVQDTTAPTLSVPANRTAEATSAAGAAVSFTASAADAVDATPTVNCTPASGSTFALGATTVNCTATDAAGNVSNGSFTVTVKDTTGPAISGVPSDMTAEATGASGADVSYTNPTANDLVDGAVQVNCSPSSGATFALGATTVSCSAVDAAGNASSASFKVTVQDTTAPALTVPPDQTEEATGASGATVNYPAATATDAVTSAPEITYSHASGSVFPLGTTTVNVKAKDAAGNESSDTFTVTVEDTTAPIITVPLNRTAEATGATGAVVTFTAPSASDIVDGALTPNCVSAPAVNLSSGSTFPLGTTTITCNVSDAANNAAAQKSFTVTVQDTTAPTLSGLTDKTIEATGPAGAVATYSPSATDLVDGGVTVNCSPVSGSTFAIGVATVNCSATDAHGNTASGSFTVTVKDTTAPALNLPANITAQATSNSKAAVSYTATATDVVDGSVSVNCAPASGSLFSVGTTTVNCSATDAHGNTANGSFTVAVSYNFNGFFQPVDNLPVLNKAQAGSAIPVKFSLGGNQGLSIFATPNSPGSAMVGCGATSLVSEVEQTVTAGGSSLSYDPVANQYVYVWKTDKSWAGTCRQLVVTFADGTVKGANFQFRK